MSIWEMHLLEQRVKRLESEATPIHECIRRMLVWRGAGVAAFTWITFLVRMHFALKRAIDPTKTSQSQQQQRDEESEVPNSESFSERSEALCRETSSSEQRKCDVHAKLESIGLKDREIAVLSRLREGWSMSEAGYLCGLSKTRVFQLHKSALNKIQVAGLTIQELEAPTTEYVDPDELDRRAIG